MPIKLPRLQSNQTVSDGRGYPTNVFARWWQVVADTLEGALNDILAALELAGVAIDIAEGIQTDIDEVKNAPVVLRSANAKFPNGYVLTSTSTITVGYGVGTITATFSGTSDNVTEGAANLYFNNTRARDALSGGTGISYNSSTGQIAVSTKLALYDGGDTPSAFFLGVVDAVDAAAFRAAIGAGTSTVTPAALTKTDDTNVTLTLGGSPSTALLAGTSLTLGWTGTLAVARGGTGVTSSTGSGSNVLSTSPSLTTPTLTSPTISGTAGNLYSGTYTPTLTSIGNVNVATANLCQYMRVGSVVTVSGSINISTTAAALTQIGISLPVASNLSNTFECAGSGNAPNGNQAASIRGNGADYGHMTYTALGTGSVEMLFHFTYRII